jgi:hypothetical protein
MDASGLANVKMVEQSQHNFAAGSLEFCPLDTMHAARPLALAAFLAAKVKRVDFGE